VIFNEKEKIFSVMFGFDSLYVSCGVRRRAGRREISFLARADGVTGYARCWGKFRVVRRRRPHDGYANA